MPASASQVGSSALGAHIDALEPLGKHLPAHGRLTHVCVCLPMEHPFSTSTEAMEALIGSPGRRLSRPATAHPGLALPTTHLGAAMASLVMHGLACGGWRQRHRVAGVVGGGDILKK